MSRVKDLSYDFLMFVQLLLFWPCVLLVMVPLSKLDEKLHTGSLRPLVRLSKRIANL